MRKEQLKERLDALQCHFTWQLGVKGCFNPSHILQKLAVEIEHTAHPNQVALLGLQAYLHQLNEQSTQALQSLRAAEEHNRGEEEPVSTAGSLVIHGNYAWIYYLQASHEEAERSLERIQRLCPTPRDPGLIPYIQAQKGWSLLAVRAQNGQRARECFEVALMLEPENVHFQAGLGRALYSSWNCLSCHDSRSKAISQLERVVHEQPNNYRAKIYLAKLLEQEDKERTIGLMEECAEKSSDPEVLKLSVLFWLPQSPERAAELLQRALQADPGYHLLYQALAKCYKIQWLNAEEQEDKNYILDTAIKHLQEIVQKHPDLDLTLVKLQLACFIGVRDPDQEEEIYKELQEKVDTLSLKCRQALSVSWGKFFVYQKRSLHEAKVRFMDGYRIPEQTMYRRECERMLKKMAWQYHHRGDTDTASAIHQFLKEANRNLPEEFSRISLD